jgi:hypothetical protein
MSSAPHVVSFIGSQKWIEMVKEAQRIQRAAEDGNQGTMEVAPIDAIYQGGLLDQGVNLPQ